MDAAFFDEEKVDPTTSFFPIENARWEKMGYFHESNPFGLLRSPWNFSPTPELLRFNSVNGVKDVTNYSTATDYHGSDCKDLLFFIEHGAVGKSLDTMLNTLEDQAHGPIHKAFGGVGGELHQLKIAALKAEIGLNEEDVLLISDRYFCYVCLTIQLQLLFLVLLFLFLFLLLMLLFLFLFLLLLLLFLLL